MKINGKIMQQTYHKGLTNIKDLISFRRPKLSFRFKSIFIMLNQFKFHIAAVAFLKLHLFPLVSAYWLDFLYVKLLYIQGYWMERNKYQKMHMRQTVPIIVNTYEN